MSTNTSVQVAIVGAGLSGLRAAKEVHDAGLSYVVLEAMDRVGGRVLSIPSQGSGGPPVELGAAWINDTTQSEMYALAKSFDFGLVKQRAEGNSFYQSADGKMSMISFSEMVPMTPEEGVELNRVLGVFSQFIDRSDLENPHLGPDAAYLDSVNCVQFVDREFGDNHVAHRLMANLAAGLVGSEPHQMSALYLFHYIKSGTGLANMSSDQKDGGQYLRNRSGNQQFAKNLAASLNPGSVRVSTPVKAIAQSKDGCKIRIGSTGLSIIQADRVIVSVPPPLYNRIDFQPALPAAKAQLASSTHLGYYSKTILLFSSAWWRSAGLSGILGSDTAMGIGPISFSRDTSVPEDNQWSITCFHVGDKGREWSKLDATERQLQFFNSSASASARCLAKRGSPIP